MKQTLAITEYFLLTQEEFDNTKTTEKILMKCSILATTYLNFIFLQLIDL